MNPFWKIRLFSKTLLFNILFSLYRLTGWELSSKMVQWCERCGSSNSVSWWDFKHDLWYEVIGCYEGCYCPECFSALAFEKKDISLIWQPINIEETEAYKDAIKEENA